MSYIKVKDKDYLIRDENNNSIINTDYNSYAAYEDAYRKKVNEVKKINRIENELDELKNDIGEIKNLLRNLVNGSQ